MSGIIDIRVITESPWKLSLMTGLAFFVLSSWNVPASIIYALPGAGTLGPIRQSALLKALLVAVLMWFVLKYKRGWVLDAVSTGATLSPSATSKQTS